MTLKEIDKEKADKINQAPIIQPNKADVEEPSQPIAELEKSKPIDNTPPKESHRQYGNKVKDYKNVISEAKKYNIDLDQKEGMPLLDSDRERIIQNVGKLVPKELATEFVNRANSIAAPTLEKRANLDQEKLIKEQKQLRKAAWADALAHFGAGMSGQSINPEDLASTALIRKRDKEFQDYKDVTERNQKAKDLWNAKTTNELIDWLDKKKSDASLSEKERQKFQQLLDFHKDEMDFKNRDLSVREKHNKAMENKKSGSGKLAKEDKPVIIQTAQKTYTLKPEEAAFYKGEILKNAYTLRAKYPGWFTEGQKNDPLTGQPTGEKTFKLNPEVKDVDMIRAYLEEKELSTAPVSQETKPGHTQKPQPSKPKADPLGLGF